MSDEAERLADLRRLVEDWQRGFSSATHPDAIDELVDQLAALLRTPAPIPMLLFCPQCRAQHVDAPEPERGWTNPPHKSHLCHSCGCEMRFRA